MKPLLFTFAGTLLLGGITGWASLSGREPVPSAGTADHRAASEPGGAFRPLATASDLMKASRDSSEKYERGESPYAAAVADWTTDEIRKALAECLTNKDFLLKANGARSVALALLAEWLKRDCDAAGEWFLSIDSAPLKAELIMSVSHSWPPEQAEKGLAFVIGHPELFPNSTGWSIIVKTIEKRALEGPQAVVALLRELREAKLGLGFGNSARFPESFDFSTLMNDPEVTTLLEKKEGEILVRAWHAQNRDAAFQWLLETKGATSLAIIASSPEGEIPGNLQWLGNKYSTLGSAQRDEFRNSIEPGYTWTSARVMKLSAGTTDPAAADELRGIGTQFIFSGNTREAIPLLAEISDPVKRLEILESAAPQGYLLEPHRRRAFTPKDEELLRKSLTGWNATESQIESIISNFKP